MSEEEKEIEEVEDEDTFFIDADELFEIPDAIVDFKDVYDLEGKPDVLNYKVHSEENIEDNKVTRVDNDPYLINLNPVNLFGQAIKNQEKRYEGFEEKSGYIKEEDCFEEFVELHQARHGHTEGGKGITFDSHPVITQMAGMSKINNINVSFGCPASCSFCKESILAREFSQVDIFEKTGIIRVTFEGVTRDVPSIAKVKFWDSENEIMIFGPIQVAIYKSFPIYKESLRRLVSGESVRVLAE
jgi:hypothetical protein